MIYQDTSPVLYGCQLLQFSRLLRKLTQIKKENLEEGKYKHDEGEGCEDERGSVLAWMIVSARSY